MGEQSIIYIDENIPLLPDVLSNCGKIIMFNGRKLKNDLLKKNDCEYLFVRSTTKVNQSLLEGTDVRFVGTATSGIDHIDTQYLGSKGIHFCSAPGANANSVAEYVLYSMFLYSKKHGISLKDKTIGVVGYGNVGKIVAEYAYLMGLKVLINDPPLKDDGFHFPDHLEYVSLDEICESADVITNHVPLTFQGETKHPTYRLLSEDHIKKIKNGGVIIHTSRGGVIDENALLERIDKRELIAAVDVFENEPMVNIDLARAAIISTPHIAGYSYDGKLKGTLMMAQQFMSFSGLNPDLSRIEQELGSTDKLSVDDFENYEKLFGLIQRNRKLNEDHNRFLNILDSDDALRSKQFDLLRKEYPIRRESLSLPNTI
jgi:erythronate-4-phosphate dehydrogenase